VSRSHCIYVVFDAFVVPIAAFTVKHEMVSWLEHQKARYHVELWSVSRFPDNPGFLDEWRNPVELPIKELLA
jgi:hypothetical protein